MIRIKKYGNRRLYNTETSRYINLDELAALVRGGETVQVVDAATGEDLTRAVLLQVVLEVLHGDVLFPSGLLHRVIRASGDHPAQRFLTQQLGAALSVIDTQMSAMEEQLPWLKAWKAGAGPVGTPGQEPAPEPEPAPSGGGEDLADLRARLAAMEERLKGKRAD